MSLIYYQLLKIFSLFSIKQDIFNLTIIISTFQMPQTKDKVVKQDRPSKSLSLFVFIAGIIASTIFVSLVLTKKNVQFNQYIFHQKQLSTEKDKFQILKTLLFYLAAFLFSLTTLTMFTRIVTVSPNPAKGKDNLIINTFNRIIWNTIEQSVIFFGFYAALLYNSIDLIAEVGKERTLAFAGLFIFARISFAVGYFLVLITGIPTWRSFGFGMNLILNFMLVSVLLNYNIINDFIGVVHPLASMIPL